MAIPLWAIVAAVIIHTLWGANAVAVKFGLEVFPPLWSAFIRFSIGAACIALWARTHRIAMMPQRGEWLGIICCAVLFTVQIGLMNSGVALTTAANASVLMATYPLFMAVLAHFFVLHDKLTATRLVGHAVCFFGACLVLWRGSGLDAGNLLGDAIVLTSAALLGGRLALTANLVRRIDPFRIIFWQMALALPAFALTGAVFESIHWDNLSWRPIAALAYQGIVIAGLGFMVTTQFLKLFRPSIMASYGFIAPISGVMLSTLMLDEAITASLVAGLSAVGFGLILISRNDRLGH